MGSHRWLIGVSAALVLLGASAPASAAPTTTRWRVDRLTAEWLMETDEENMFAYIAVSVTHSTNVDTGEVRLTSSAGKSMCELTGPGSGCGTMMKPYEVIRYESDPAFATATAVLKRGAKRHSISWATRTPFAIAPPVGQEPNFCGGTTTKIYVSSKNAIAEGRVFGREVSTAGETSAFDDNYRFAERMVQTLDTEECVD